MTTELITPAESFAERTDVLIIGSGAAGLTAALTIVEADPIRSVTVITRGEPHGQLHRMGPRRPCGSHLPGRRF